MKINLDNYDVIHLGVSGGKDSTAALLWLVHQSGWDPAKFDVTFCDTGNEDLFTYRYLEMLSTEVHPVKTVHPPMDFWELAKYKKRFPSRRARFCTESLKIIPSIEYVWGLGSRVLMLNGVRSAEAHNSNDRGKVASFGYDEMTGCDVYRPILDWSLDDVWDIQKRYLNLESVLDLVRTDPYLDRASEIYFEKNGIEVDFKAELVQRMQKNGIPRNPLYDMGATRVGCFPCINSKKAEVRAMAKYRPQRIDFIREKELTTGKINPVDGKTISTFFARKTVPLAHRTKLIETTKGERMLVATIDDVARWSRTARGGKQFDFDLLQGESFTGCLLGNYCE